LVEILTGLLFLATFLLTYPFTSLYAVAGFVALLVFWSAFIVLVVYDVKHTLVPFKFSLPLIGSALAVSVFEALSASNIGILYDAFFGALFFGGSLFLLFLVTHGKGMGLGDAYVGVALGLLFGIVQSFEVIAFSFWIGAAFGIILLILKKRFTIKSEVPFVPFLFAGTILGVYTALSPLTLVATLISVL